MFDNSIIPFGKNDLSNNEKQLPTLIVPVSFNQCDNGHYRFYFDVDDNINASMEESDNEYNQSKFSKAEFDDSITKSEKMFYLSAASCGFLTGCIDSLCITDSLLKGMNAENFKDKNFTQLFISAARLCGYKKRDYGGAVKFLFDLMGERFLVNGIISELSRTPNATGLVFSILSQYTREMYSLDPSGKLNRKGVPYHYVIGRNDAEKILYGFLYWCFYMVIGYARRQTAYRFEGIPQEIYSLMEVLGSLPIFRDISLQDQKIEAGFSEFLRRVFENTEILNEVTNATRKFDLLHTITERDNKLKAQMESVLINECLTRGAYTVIKLSSLIERENVDSVYRLLHMDLTEVLPVNNRIISRMCLISSSVFVAVNVSGALLKALFHKRVNGRPFATSFVSNLNIPGIGRFLFAIAQDIDYLGEDIKIHFFRADDVNRSNSADNSYDQEDAERILASLNLNEYQYRILYSLENFAIEYDLQKAKKAEEIRKKEEWHKLWKNGIMQMVGESGDSYFLRDENAIYRELFELNQGGDDKSWFYLMTIEMALFDPYYNLPDSSEKGISKQKRNSDYMIDQYALKQTAFSEKDIKAIRQDSAKYEGIIDGSTVRKRVRATAAVGTTVVLGSAAFIFAPAIAVALAGGTLPGLYGAALTNASLALFGGGSLAAGGLGMAGGTAVITGGGALIGLTGSSTALALADAALFTNEIRTKYFAKLLTYAKDALIAKKDDYYSVDVLRRMFRSGIDRTEERLRMLREERCDLNKEMIEQGEKYIKSVRSVVRELEKMLRK